MQLLKNNSDNIHSAADFPLVGRDASGGLTIGQTKPAPDRNTFRKSSRLFVLVSVVLMLLFLSACGGGGNGGGSNNPSETLVALSSVTGAVTEAGEQATFTVRLLKQPSMDVVIPLESSDETEGTVQPSSLTFNSTNWSSEQIVTVTGVDDDLLDGDQPFTVTLSPVQSGDTTFNGKNPDDVILSNLDNEAYDFDVSAVSRNTGEEGRTATFTVKLLAKPDSDVTIPISSSDPGEGDVSPDSLTFQPDNWNSPQTVTVTGAGDDILDGDVNYTIILGMANSNDANFKNLDPNDVAVTNMESLLTGFQFLQADNMSLAADLTADIIDSAKGVVILLTPQGVDSTVDYTALQPTLTMPVGDSADDDASADYTNPVKIQVTGTSDSDRSQSYWVITGQRETVPDTGLDTCFAGNTDTPTPCAGTGQDGEYTINARSFTDNGNGTISDHTTGWMWQKCSYGQTWTGSACTPALDSLDKRNWYEASGTAHASLNPGGSTNICGEANTGGHSDWRLPTVEELQRLINYAALVPAAYGHFTDFANTGSEYWSSSATADASLVWVVIFDDGQVLPRNKPGSYYVRCIRSGQ